MRTCAFSVLQNVRLGLPVVLSVGQNGVRLLELVGHRHLGQSHLSRVGNAGLVFGQPDEVDLAGVRLLGAVAPAVLLDELLRQAHQPPVVLQGFPNPLCAGVVQVRLLVSAVRGGSRVHVRCIEELS